MTKITRDTTKRVVKPTTQAAVFDKPSKPSPSDGYKVFFEQVATEKKKLRLSDVTNPRPPRGFAFLAIGHPDLAEYCKEVSRRNDIPVSIVSASQKQDPRSAKISKHLHRIGYHFRQDIFDQGCALLGFKIKRGKLLRELLPNEMWGFEHITDNHGSPSDSAGGPGRTATEQEALATKLAIQELFPNIPHKDLEDIWRRAFRAGAQTVGNAQNLPLSRRVQLAVVAHARHQYTEYDRLLRVVDWREARAKVQAACLAKMVEWRGEQNDDSAIEEVLREVIVIDDDDADDQDDYTKRSSVPTGRQSSVNEDDSDITLEIIAKPAEVTDLVPGNETNEPLPTHYAERLGIDLPKLDSSGQEPLREDQRRMLHARWQEARERQGPPPSPYGYAYTQGLVYDDPVDDIELPVDYFGKVPAEILINGLTLVRQPMYQLTTVEASRAVSAPVQHPSSVAHARWQQVTSVEVIDLTSPPRIAVRAPAPLSIIGQPRRLRLQQSGQPIWTEPDTAKQMTQSTPAAQDNHEERTNAVKDRTETALDHHHRHHRRSRLISSQQVQQMATNETIAHGSDSGQSSLGSASPVSSSGEESITFSA